MTTPLENGYIGLSEFPSVVRASESHQNEASLNLKETELRLGLPGSGSPERSKSTLVGVSIFGKDLESSLSPSKNSTTVSGAKRGFSDAINGCKWVFSKFEAETSPPKVGGVVLFSPRSGCKNDEAATSTHQSAALKPIIEEGFAVNAQSKPLQEKKREFEAPAPAEKYAPSISSPRHPHSNHNTTPTHTHP